MSVSCLVVERPQQHEAQLGRRPVDVRDADVEEITRPRGIEDRQPIAGHAVGRTVDVGGGHQWKQVLGRRQLGQRDGDSLSREHRSIVVDVQDDQPDSYHLKIPADTVSSPS